MAFTSRSLARPRLLSRIALIASFALFTGAPALAQSIHSDEELPPETSLFKLPRETYIRVVAAFRNSTAAPPKEWKKHGAYLFMEPRDKVYELREGDEWSTRGLNDKGDILGIYYKSGFEPQFLNMPENNSAPRITTVGEFHDYFGNYLHIVYHNPANPKQYEGLPEDVVTDLVMAKITAAIKADDYKSAMPHFVYLESKNPNLPESFWYYYTMTAANLKDADKTRALGTKYLTKFGKKGKYYDKVLALMAQ